MDNFDRYNIFNKKETNLRTAKYHKSCSKTKNNGILQCAFVQAIGS